MPISLYCISTQKTKTDSSKSHMLCGSQHNMILYINKKFLCILFSQIHKQRKQWLQHIHQQLGHVQTL